MDNPSVTVDVQRDEAHENTLNVTDEQQSAATRLGRHQCHVCDQVFGRSEHLTRHSQSHSSERSLKCRHCQKGFYRIDALRRHELVHSQPRKTLGRSGRACSNCAAARRKCDGGEICSACQRRSLRCDSFQRNKKPSTEISGYQASNDEPVDPGSRNPAPSPRPQSSGRESQSGGKETTAAVEYQSGSQPSPMANFSADRFNNRSSQITPFASSSSKLATSAIEGTADSAMEHFSHFETESPGSWNHDNMFAMNWSFVDENASQGAEMDDAFYAPYSQSNVEHSSQPEGDAPGYHTVSTTNDQTSFLSLRTDGIAEGLVDVSASPAGSMNGSHNTGSTDGTSPGHYYVDGDGARLPRLRSIFYKQHKRHLSVMSLVGVRESPHSTAGSNGFNEATVVALNASILGTTQLLKISQESYREIEKCFLHTCTSSSHFQSFRSQLLPPAVLFDHFLDLYFRHFQPTLPFIHVPSFKVTDAHWLLLLAFASIGSQYAATDDPDLSHALHELLRRAISVISESDESQRPDRISFVQVKLLNSIGLMYSGSATAYATCWLFDLRKFFDDEWMDHLTITNTRVLQSSSQPDVRWKHWCENEGLRRTGYCIWLMDCMFVYHFLSRPQLSNEDKKVPLPCQEVLWEADTVLDWDQLHSCAIPSSSKQTALQQIYIEKRLPPSTGEFSRILLIHALFRRTWEVESYVQQPLTQWTPTAERQSSSNLIDGQSVWPPKVPLFSKWRNSACDCLDVLHWHANSVIGAASGMEHPTVLHLHVARVVLLTPFREILKLATLIGGQFSQHDSEELIQTHRYVQKWAREDQHKARLAMIHAGVLFWHVRRYSISSYCEPPDVLLSTLAMWAYGKFAPRTPSSDAEDEEPSDYPTTIQLDRPADDELVQLFVSRGTTMRAMITGVGNLCGKQGPQRVLVEGKKLLEGSGVWGVGLDGIRLIDNLLKEENISRWEE